MADATKKARNRLDQPAKPGRRPLIRTPNVDPERFGQATEGIARFLGTGRYLVIQTVIIIVWIVVNIIPATTFDPYTFTFLTLILSLQAAYAAPLILLATNRQDDRDRVNMLEDRDRASRNLEDTEFLARELADIRLALGDAVTRDFLRNELRDLLEEINERSATPTPLAGPPGSLAGAPAKKKKKRRRRPPEQRTEPADEPLHEPQRPDPEPDETHDSGEGADLPKPPG